MLQHLVDAIRIAPTMVPTDVPPKLFKDPHACWKDSVMGLSPRAAGMVCATMSSLSLSPPSMHANMSLLASPAVLHVIKTGAARYKECLVFLMYA